MAGCLTCDPIGTHGTGCGLCRDGTASGGIGTQHTNSDRTESPDSVTADTESRSLGTSTPVNSPYNPIVGDLLFMLHGRSDEVYVTPTMQIAAMAIELELAERMLDESYMAETSDPNIH